MLSRNFAPSGSGASSQPESVEPLWAALRAEPGNVRIAEDLADALTSAGRPAEAAAMLEAALALRPDSRPLRRMLARAAAPAGHDAEGHWRELLMLDARDEEAMVELGGLLSRRGALPEAIELFQRALRARPENPAAAFGLGEAWAELGEADKAREAFGRYLSLEPEDRLGAAAALARLDPDALTPAYLRILFDQYADRFDAELVGKLDYRAPGLLREALLQNGVAARAALDLGCGTGLAGLVLRDLAGRLDGVDLSPRMVNKARERGIYDGLFTADAVEFLDSASAAYDLIVAADVLVYLGDLQQLFRAAGKALRPEGAFAFTVERLEGDGFRLGPKRRFAHSEAYLRRVSADAGLEPRYRRQAALRTEGKIEVDGLVFLLCKPG